MAAAAYYEDHDFDAGTDLYVPARTMPVIGPTTVAAARRLNPAVLASLSADDADAFLRRAQSNLRRIRRFARQVSSVTGPLLVRALPMVQRVAGLAGPWGRLVSAGIGAARGAAAGGGLRGAFAGAISGAIPGIGGQLASAVLGGDGADDDAALDALADMADAGQVHPAVALPLGAGLAARAATRQAMHHVGYAAPPAAHPVWMRGRSVEQALLQGGLAIPGGIGRRLRLLRAASRLTANLAGAQGTPAEAARALPTAAHDSIQRVAQLAQRAPQTGASSPAAAAERIAARQRILSQFQRLMAQALQA